jgi:L,D-peptidoglycan transpeptidase YkuD (ErfK/YbiS/YcfS/YnhG family)
MRAVAGGGRAVVLSAAALCALSVIACGCKSAPKPASSRPLSRSRQLVVVRTAAWSSAEGTLQRYARTSASASWQSVSPPVAVTLGSAGMAWGRGLLPEQPGPQKREGDGKAPAGLFRLTSTFGYDPEPPSNLPHTHATTDLLCIDDPASLRYNRIMSQSEIQYPDWKSAERLRRNDDQYRIGVVVAHNTDPVQPGAGSCIFLHIWASPGQPTPGCTTLEAAPLEALAHWLDWIADPVLVQLPEAEYARLRAAWALP